MELNFNVNLGRRKKGVPQVGKDRGFYYSPSEMLGKMDNKIKNPDNIPLSTYRKMQYYPQIAAGLAVIAFTVQRVDWYIQSNNKKQAREIEENIKEIWNPLIRSMSRGLIYGFSPNVKVFEERDGLIRYKKIKDMRPEDTTVRVDRFGSFLGFQLERNESKDNIPPELAFWYVQNMREGNWYGDSALKAVYEPWYYIRRIQLFTNRYYERFGDPAMIGHYRSGQRMADEEGNTMDAGKNMANIMQAMRSSSIAVLPGDRDENGHPMYDVKFLESQMRGMDFHVYLNYLDSLILRGMLIPDLIYGGKSGGSFALGEEQRNTFLTNIEGILDNFKDYIDAYIIPPLVTLNYGDSAPKAEWIYQPLDKPTKQMLIDLVDEMVSSGKVMPDVQDISDRLGVKLTEVEQDELIGVDKPEDVESENIPEEVAASIASKMSTRLSKQVDKIQSSDDIKSLKLGYKGKYVDAVKGHFVDTLSPDKSRVSVVEMMAGKAAESILESVEDRVKTAMSESYPNKEKMKKSIQDTIHNSLVGKDGKQED